MLRRCLAPHLLKTLAPDVTLEQMLQFAVEHVPYYRRFQDFNNLSDFPLLTKEIIREESDNLLSEDRHSRTWRYNTSGGSTGEPVRFGQDDEYLRRTRYSTLQSKRWCGYRPGDRLVRLWGNPGTLRTMPRGPKACLRDWILNTELLDTFCMDEHVMLNHLARIRRRPPRLIVGFASSLYEISRCVLRHNLNLQGVGAVVSTAGTLFPEMRDTMERAFRCRVFNRYGSSEVSIIAAEDGTGHGLRVAPTVHVETLRADGSACEDGECGEIAVTSLANFVMPLIRFRIGDVGALQRVNGKMYLEKVLGRTVELFQTRQGTKIDGQYFIQCMYFRNWVKRFCFRQVEYERVVIDVELAAEPPSEDLRDIEESIKHVMGHDMTVVWNYVSEIKPLPSGKRLYTICEV